MREKREAGIAFLTVSTLAVLCLLISIPAEGQEEPTDSDLDGMPDDWEDTYGLNRTDPSDAAEDPDSDGLLNLDEYLYRVYPFDPDSDDDGMPDGWEVEYGLDPKVWSADNDEDEDGYTDLEEYRRETGPLNPYHRPDDDDTDPSAEEEDMGDAASSFMVLICFVFIVGFIVFLLIMGIYSKIKRDKLLEHETRQRIMEFIKENPGTYYSQIRKELDLAHGVVTHHLNMLETQELIFSKQDRQFRRFYADGLYKDTPMVTGTQKRVLDEIRRYPGLSQKQISEHLDLYPMMVSYHVGQLENLGLVEKKKKGRRNLLYALSGPGKDKETEEISRLRGPFEGPAPEMMIAEN